MTSLRRAVTAMILFWGFLFSSAYGQQSQLPYPKTISEHGVMPFTDQVRSPIDSIEPINGKMNMSIPLVSLPAGRGGTGFDLALNYDSNIFDTQAAWQMIQYSDDGINYNLDQVYYRLPKQSEKGGGWQYNYMNYGLYFEEKPEAAFPHYDTITHQDLNTTPQNCTEEKVKRYRLRIGLPDGSMHLLYMKGAGGYGADVTDGFYGIRPDGSTINEIVLNGVITHTGYNICDATFGWNSRNQDGPPLTYFTTDGSYLRVEIDRASGVPWTQQFWRLYYPDGRKVVGRYYQGFEMYDANGNKVTIENFVGSESPHIGVYTVIHDETNDEKRKIYIDYGTDSSSGLTRDTISATGPHNETLRWAVDWQTINTYFCFNAFPEIGNYTGYQYVYYQDPNHCDVISFNAIKYIHFPSADPNLPYPKTIGQEPDVQNSYEFGYDLFDYYDFVNGNPNYKLGLGALNSIRTPTGSQHGYQYTPALYELGLYYDPAWNINMNICRLTGEYNLQMTDRTVHFYDGMNSGQQSLAWHYDYTHYYNSSASLLSGETVVTNPDGGQSHYVYNKWNVYNEFPEMTPGEVKSYYVWEPGGKMIKRRWSPNIVDCPWAGCYPQTTGQNLYLSRETVAYPGASPKTAVTDYGYDQNGNLLTKTEYEYVDFSGSGIESGTTEKRKTTYQYTIEMPPANNTYGDSSSNTNGYWNPDSPKRLNLVQRQTVSMGVNTYAATEYVYDDPIKGNVTAEKHWDNVKSPSLPGLGQLSSFNGPSANAQVVTRGYDQHGNLTDIYEPPVSANGPLVQTHITYNSAGTSMIQVDQAYGTNIQRSTYYQWDPSGRAIASKTDLNNNLSVVYGYDKLFRQTAATSRNEATSTWLSQTTTSYNDVEKKVATTSDLRQYLDGKLQAISYYDDLGRVRLVQKSDGVDLDGTGSNGIKIKTIDTYPTGGRRVVTSNPYRQLSDPTLEWTCTQYDVGGRVAAVAMFKGSNAPTDCENTYNRTGITRTAYDTDAVTITDPALKTRYQKHDALGRTVQVVEDPNGLGFNTSYLYNPLDNLTQVNQGSQTPRTFNYSSLSRLLSANNPESGTIQYQYYDSGELWQKTDARGVVTTMTYDALHRIQNKSYSNDNGSTPTVSYDYYKYAAEAPQIGQLKSVSSGVASTVYGYNALGKVSTSTHAITGYTGNLSFTYDWYLNGSQKDIYYPSGRQVHYTVDDAGRTLQVGVYADSLAYTPDGRATQMRLGNNLWETRNYLPPGTNSTSYMLETSQGIGDKLRLDYSFAEGANNGNVMQQQIQWPNHALIAQTYTYDAFNRLQTASEANGFNRTYEYDQFGNRSVLSSSGLAHVDPREPTSQSQINHMNNQLAMSGVSYDTAGNQTTFGSLSMNYDAENRTTTVSGAGSGTYSYDGDGRRVKKVWGATTTFYLYDALGRMAAEYSTETPTSAGTSYLFTDMLGSTRAITTNTGVMIECYDYLPFGRMLSDSDNGRSSVGCFQSNPDVQITGNVSQKFTGKERDQETGLDYFGARYYSGAQGRWMRPDPLLSSGRQTEPQSWNRYAYVLGNPLKYNDPTGLYEFADCSGNPKCAEYKKKFKNAVGAANKALASKSLPDDQAKSLSEVMNYLGDEGPGKGHGRIVFDAIKGRAAGQYAGNDRMIFDMGKIDKLSQRPDPGNIKYDSTTILGSVIAHETSHDLDDSKGLLPTYFENNPHVVGMFETSERNAYNIGSYVFKGLNATDPSGSWRTNWVTEGLSTVDKETLRGIGVENGVKRSMEDIRKQGK